jgi:hypothetical protein
MQQHFGYGWTNPFMTTFARTWSQGTSRPPAYGGSATGARMPAEPRIGQGIYKYLEDD